MSDLDGSISIKKRAKTGKKIVVVVSGKECESFEDICSVLQAKNLSSGGSISAESCIQHLYCKSSIDAMILESTCQDHEVLQSILLILVSNWPFTVKTIRVHDLIVALLFLRILRMNPVVVLVSTVLMRERLIVRCRKLIKMEHRRVKIGVRIDLTSGERKMAWIYPFFLRRFLCRNWQVCCTNSFTS
jgi:hypothetical protein